MEQIELAVPALRQRPGTKWHRYPDDVLPAWVAEMDFAVAEPVQAAINQVVQLGGYGYEDPATYEALANAFAEHMARRFGWSANPEWVVPVGDLLQALYGAVLAYSAPGEGVVLQTPIYPPFLAAVTETSRRVVESPLIEAGGRLAVDGAGLRRAAEAGARVLLFCNPHNPTGRVFERDELLAVSQAAVEYDLVVVSDEIHADLVYPGRHHIPLATLGPDIAARTVTITSATKGFNIPGLRCGVMHFGSAELLGRLQAHFPQRLLGKANVLGVAATVAAWREGEQWLGAVMRRLLDNRAYVGGFLGDRLPEIGYHPPEGTYFAWLDCRPLALLDAPDQFFLDRARVALSDGRAFGPPGDGHVRLNFATSPAILEEILERMARAIRATAPRA